jgi:hypothetical protein
MNTADKRGGLTARSVYRLISPCTQRRPFDSEPQCERILDITRDGRVIYATTWEHCNKSDDADKVCIQERGLRHHRFVAKHKLQEYIEAKNIIPKKVGITQNDVKQECASFAAFHQLL